MTGKRAIAKLTVAAMAGASSLAMATPASAQIEPYIGQMMQTGFNFCPRGWALTSGQLLAISQNTALFSLLGTTYGGNGQTTFALPDLRGRVAVHQGQGPGLSPYVLGQVGGADRVTLTAANLPPHNHRGGIQSVASDANSTSPNGNAFALAATDSYLSGIDPTGNTMDRAMIQIAPAGNSLPISTRSPYLTMNWCIALQGIFPQRS